MTFQQDIQTAVAQFDRYAAMDAARSLAAEIRKRGASCTPEEAHAAIKPLKDARMFEELMVIADAAFESGLHDNDLRAVYVQALIDTGHVEAALPSIDDLVCNAAKGSSAESEARGLRGRAYKQLYVNGGGGAEQRQEYFDKAFSAYYDAYSEPGKKSERLWHGINAVALYALAHRCGLKCPEIPPLVNEILEEARRQIDAGSDDPWLYATGGEAAVASGKFDDAKAWYAQFAANPKVTAFALNSALRQLKEVWQLDDDAFPGEDLLPLLRSELLARGGGEVGFQAGDIHREMQRAGLQKTFGGEAAREFPWYRTGLDRCYGVCRITKKLGRAWGTGFLVRGGDFIPRLGNQPCILTNDHVVSETNSIALKPSSASIEFQALDDGRKYTVKKIEWSSAALDAALLSVKEKLPDCEPYPIADEPPPAGPDEPERILVIGHPLGGTLAISLYDNLLLAHNDVYIHYRSPTEPGSSGSPVFNDAWDLVALHHRGLENMRKLDNSGETYQANEGILISRIRDAARKSAAKGATSPPRPRSSRPSTPSKTASRRRT